MKKILFSALAPFLLSILFLQCKKNDTFLPGNNGDNNGQDTGQSAVHYNANDTTITLDGGHLTLIIPAGAMPDTLHPSISTSNADFPDTSVLLHQFRLLPEGTRFKKQVMLEVHYDSAWLKGNSLYNMGVAFRSDADGKWYMPAGGSADTVHQTLSIPITHFSHWSIYSCFQLYMKYDAQFSHNNSRMIYMPEGEKADVWLTMVLPPWWSDKDDIVDPIVPLVPDDPGKDPDLDLIAPLVPVSKNQEQSLDPNAWLVQDVVNGNTDYGTIYFGRVNEKNQDIFTYSAPDKIPSPDPLTIAARIHTKHHGWITLYQKVSINPYGYLPSPGINAITYDNAPSGDSIRATLHITTTPDNTIDVIQEATTYTGGGLVQSKGESLYDDMQTTFKSWPSNKEYELYDSLRSQPLVTDSSFSGFPIRYSIPDNATAGQAIAFDGNIRTYIETGAQGVVLSRYTLNAHNANGVVEGTDSVQTPEGTFRCLKIHYDYIVQDTIITTPGTPSEQIHTDQYTTSNTIWLSKGIGLVKVYSADDKTGAGTVLLRRIYRDE